LKNANKYPRYFARKIINLSTIVRGIYENALTGECVTEKTSVGEVMESER